MGWWDKKIGPSGPVRQPLAPQYDPSLLPRGVGAPVAHVAAPVAPQAVPMDPGAEVDAGTAVRIWQGSKEVQAETARVGGSCPNCGSPRYFSHVQGAVMNSKTGQTAAPTPGCFDCGYPRQQGLIDAAVTVEGGSNASRQGAMLPLSMDVKR